MVHYDSELSMNTEEFENLLSNIKKKSNDLKNQNNSKNTKEDDFINKILNEGKIKKEQCKEEQIENLVNSLQLEYNKINSDNQNKSINTQKLITNI